MASGLPKFLKQSVKYDDLYKDEIDVYIAPLTIPVSKVKVGAPLGEKLSSSSKRKVTDPSETPGSRYSKRLKLPSTQEVTETEAPQSLQKLAGMLEGHVAVEAMAEWDKMRLTEASRAITYANAQSLYLKLKFDEKIDSAARGDMKLREELKEMRSRVKNLEDGEKKLQDSISKLKNSESRLQKEKKKLDTLVISQDKENEELFSKVAELEKTIEGLNIAINTYKTTRVDREKSKYADGYNNAVKDYISTTMELYPETDWTLMGDEAMKILEDIQKSKATEEGPKPTDSASKVPEKANWKARSHLH